VRHSRNIDKEETKEFKSESTAVSIHQQFHKEVKVYHQNSSLLNTELAQEQ